MMITIIVSVAVVSFFLGVAATVLWLMYYGKTVDEASIEFEQSISKGDKR